MQLELDHNINNAFLDAINSDFNFTEISYLVKSKPKTWDNESKTETNKKRKNESVHSKVKKEKEIKQSNRQGEVGFVTQKTNALNFGNKSSLTSNKKGDLSIKTPKITGREKSLKNAKKEISLLIINIIKIKYFIDEEYNFGLNVEIRISCMQEEADDESEVKVEESMEVKVEDNDKNNEKKFMKKKEILSNRKKQSQLMIRQNILKIKQLVESHKDIRRRKNISDEDISVKKEHKKEENAKEKNLPWVFGQKKAFGRKSR